MDCAARNLFIVFALYIISFIAPTAMAMSRPTNDEDSPVREFTLHSEVFDNTRTIRVLLPLNYDEPENADVRYPVFYFNDGISTFAAFDIVNVARDLIRDGVIPALIIVGVDNGGSTNQTSNPTDDRANEFLPVADVGYGSLTVSPFPNPQPKGALYPRFLIDEVMPAVESRYRTLKGPGSTYLGGSSFGAVSAVYTVISRPDIFGKLLLESPPIWIGANLDLMKMALAAEKWPETVYLAYGTKEILEDESTNAMTIEALRLFAQIIRARAPDTRLLYVEQEGATHTFDVWRERLPAALEFLFGGG